MKSTIISMLIVLTILVALPMLFFSDNPVSAQLGFGKKLLKPASPSTTLPTNISTVTTDSAVQVYRWRDENGHMQFSSTPPPNVSEVELIDLQPNKNVIQAVKVPAKAAEVASTAAPEISNPYSPKGMSDLLKQATQLKDIVNQQQLDQQQSLDTISNGSKR
jgi:hypothetical protein